MASREFKGKTVDEAIFNGLTAMGLSLDEVEIEVLQEGTKGFLGFGKSALVRLTEREQEPVLPVEIKPEPKPQRREPRAPREKRRKEWRRERGEIQGEQLETRHEQPEVRHEQPQAPQPETEQTPDLSVVESESISQEIVAVEPISTPESAKAQEFLNGLFKAMDVKATCQLAKNSDAKNLHIDIEGADTAVLIGRRGDTLDALQYLTGLVINRDHDEYIRVMLNAEGYREKREQTLEGLARRLAANVIHTGRPVKLEPMNPYERRILHATLQSNPKVETFSEGVDPNRRVVIRRKRGTGSGQGRGGSYDRRRKPRTPREPQQHDQ